MSRPVIIDCDPGIDDAIALMLAFASRDELDVEAVTTVAGNVPLQRTAANARRIVELCGASEVPVHAGCPRPLLQPLVTAGQVHGETGLEGADLAPPGGPLATIHAVDRLRDAVAARPGQVTVVAVGPLTNVACAIVQAPQFASSVREIVIMGGAAGAGNVTPWAEFNFHVDPHAAQIVLGSGAPVTIFGLDVTGQVRTSPAWIERLRILPSPVARAAAGMLSFYGNGSAALHDVLAVGYLLRPGLFGFDACHVDVVLEPGPQIGRSRVDRSAANANARMGFEADADDFLAFLLERLARFDDRDRD